jgi:hypothetical protein
MALSESFRNPDEAENCCQGQHAALRHRYPSLLPNIELFSLTRESRRFTASHHRGAADGGQWRKAADGRNVFLSWIIPTLAVDLFGVREIAVLAVAFDAPLWPSQMTLPAISPANL